MDTKNKIDKADHVWHMGIRDPKEAITMILSGHCTHGSPDGALLHVRAFDAAATDIIKFMERLDNDIPEPFKSLKESAMRKIEEMRNNHFGAKPDGYHKASGGGIGGKNNGFVVLHPCRINPKG
jgi:hypothetical protein